MSISEKLTALRDADREARMRRQEMWDKRMWLFMKAVIYVIVSGWTFLLIASLKKLFS